LTGTFCGGTELECNCNYCDDFENDDRCANACRVMNGYTYVPRGWGTWRAKRLSSASSTSERDCSWMALRSGRGDDCKKCDKCALQCRLANPMGTCS